MIPAVIENCAGIDVGKAFLVACVMRGRADEEPRIEQHTFGITNGDVERLLDWLVEQQRTDVAIESTGVYGNRSSTFSSRHL
jgi:hypothetical protein